MTSATEYAQHVAKIRRRAEGGARDSALFLIQEFVNHAHAYESSNIPDSDKVVIGFFVRAMREILEDIPPTKALCLDAEGRREIGIKRDLWLAFEVYEHHKELGVVSWAIDRAARHTKAPKPTVRAAWKKFGGLKGVSMLAAQFDPDALQSMRLLAQHQNKGE